MSLKNCYALTTKINWKRIKYGLRANIFNRLVEDYNNALEYHNQRQDDMPDGYELGLTTDNYNPENGRYYSDNELKTKSKLYDDLSVDSFLENLYLERCYVENGITIFKLDDDKNNYLNYLKLGAF